MSDSKIDPMRVGLWVLVTASAVTLLAVAAPLSAVAYGVPVALALLLAAVQSAGILVSPVRPVLGVILSVIAVLAFALLCAPDGPWPIMVTSMIGHAIVVLVVARTHWLIALVSVIVTGLGGVIVVLNASVSHAFDAEATADLIVFASLGLVAWLIGVLIAQWASVRAQLMQERAVSAGELARRELVEERTRLARELHDVVAHGMSAIQVQASSARYRIPTLSPEAVGEFDDIAALARTSMAEMRSLLAVLRSEGSAAEAVPQPTVANIPQLIELARRSGTRVELDDRLTPKDATGLDPVISLTVYRVVQESLSNVARHATGADTLVTLERRDDAVCVEVRNGTTEPVRTLEGVPDVGGNGIRGMRERVSLHGGTLETERTDDGGFVVRAVIPIPPRRASA